MVWIRPTSTKLVLPSTWGWQILEVIFGTWNDHWMNNLCSCSVTCKVAQSKAWSHLSSLCSSLSLAGEQKYIHFLPVCEEKMGLSSKTDWEIIIIIVRPFGPLSSLTTVSVKFEKILHSKDAFFWFHSYVWNLH